MHVSIQTIFNTLTLTFQGHSRSNVMVVLDSPYMISYWCLLNTNRKSGKIWPNSTPLRDIRLRNLSDLEFDLSRSLKVKCNSVIEFPIYAFLLMFNSNVSPNSASSQDKRLQNLSDLEFDLSRSLKVKCDGVIGLSIHVIWFLMYIY